MFYNPNGEGFSMFFFIKDSDIPLVYESVKL